MIEIKILIPGTLDGQYIISSEPDLTPEQWTQVGRRLVEYARTANYINLDEFPLSED